MYLSIIRLAVSGTVPLGKKGLKTGVNEDAKARQTESEFSAIRLNILSDKDMRLLKKHPTQPDDQYPGCILDVDV